MFKQVIATMYIDEDKAKKKSKSIPNFLLQILGRNGVSLDEVKIINEEDGDSEMTIALVNMIMGKDDEEE